MSTTTTLEVDGMTCDHCIASVRSAVGDVDGVTEVSVDLASGQVTVTSQTPPDPAALRAAVEDAGYEVRS